MIERFSGRTAMILFFVVGLGLRLALLFQTSALGPEIADERQYLQLARSLVAGDGLAWASGEPTSLRPPLYPALLAGIWSLTGEDALQAVRAVQFLLALGTAFLVYALGRQAFGAAVGRAAAAFVWLYPPLVFANFTILTETLFTLLLTAFALLTVMLVQRPGPVVAVGCGLALGLAALTRSVLWPMPLLLCPLLVLVLEVPVRRRVALAGLVLAGYTVVVGPWAVRNTRLQGVVTIVDTMGGMNLRMGNYEHTPEDRMWDAVSLKGEKNWVYALTQEPAGTGPPAEAFTEGHKDKWAQRKAVEYMMAHPGTTLRRAAIKFGDFWGLERSFIAGVQQRLYDPPLWFAALAAAAMVASDAAAILLGLAGMWLARPAWRVQLVLLLPVVLVTAIHTIVFGHSRYHVPLVPILAVYGAALLASDRPSGWLERRTVVVGAAVVLLAVVGGWLRQLIVVDAARVRALLDRFW